MKKYISFICIIFAFQTVFPVEIRIDYLGPNNFQNLYDFKDFYYIWDKYENDKYSCYLDEKCVIDELCNYLDCKEMCSDNKVCPIAIVYFYNDEECKVYEVSLRRMKMMDDSKVYKIPWEFWLLISRYLPDQSIFEYYSRRVLEKNIVGSCGCHYTD